MLIHAQRVHPTTYLRRIAVARSVARHFSSDSCVGSEIFRAAIAPETLVSVSEIVSSPCKSAALTRCRSSRRNIPLLCSIPHIFQGSIRRLPKS